MRENKIRLAIVGSRDFKDNALFNTHVKEFIKSIPEDVVEIVSGGTEGTDTMAEELANIIGLSLKVFKPEYSKYGMTAPLVRNEHIVDNADYVLAFVKGESRGTHDTINKATKKGIPVKVINISDEHRAKLSIKKQQVAEEGYEQEFEDDRRMGNIDYPFPEPRYRLKIEDPKTFPYTFHEGGYFQYKEDAEYVMDLLISFRHDISVEIITLYESEKNYM